MKNSLIYSIFIIALISTPGLFAKNKIYEVLQNKNANFYDIQNVMNEELDENNPLLKKTWKQFKRWENFWNERVFPSGNFPDALQLYNEYNHYEKNSKKINNNQIQTNYSWKSLGPYYIPESTTERTQGIGRINIVRFNPQDEFHLWIGAATGGVWYSKDGGNSWNDVPFFNFLSMGVSDIAISPSNPEIMYVSTGDADGTVGTSGGYYSIGVVKSTDGGTTWNLTSLSKEYYEKKIFTRILINPSNPNNVIVGSNDGIFTSDDGGSTWKVRTSEYGVIDMEFKPGDANIVYASTYGFSGTNSIIKSTDGGVTWNLLHQINNTYRLNIEVTPKAPNYIYCLSAATDAGFNSIEVSDDEGNSWTEVSDLSTAGNVLGWYYGSSGDTGGQGIYDLALAVSPKDENLLFTGGINIWKSTTMGTDLDLNTHWFGYDSKPFVHADIHDLKFSPSGKRLYACNDGGISFTANNGADWTDLTNGINITQFYRLSSSDSYPSVIIAGAQDNGSSGLIDGTWKHLSAGDGMECLVHPTNPQRIYTSIYYGTFYRSNNGGQNYSTIITRKTTGENSGWVTPFVLNPSNPSTLLCGHQNVWINRRGGDVGQWSKISDFGSSQVLKAIAVAPSDSNVIYACNTTTLFVTYDGGLNWNNILTSGSSSLTYIVVDPKRPERIWVTKSGFTLSDKVWEYDGENWINISGNLPNIPVNTIAYQKNSPDRLYVGTDFGVYYSDYNSAYWEKFGTGMPNLVVNELEINYSSKTMLRAATYGRGVWECEVMDCNLPQPVINIFGDTEFCEGKSVKLELEGDYDNFVWSNGEQTKSITVKDNGAYSVIIFNDNGCNAKSQAVNVKVNQNRIMSVTADLGHFALCGDETALELRASIGFDQYLWSTGETTRRITITEPGDYYVLGITDDGCQTNSDTLHIVRSDNPTKPSINRDGRILTASDGYSYQWYRNGKKITDSTGQTYTLSEEDIAIFKVEIFNEAGCSNFSDDFDVENSVNEYDNNSNHLSISPNPNFGKFHVNFKGIISSDAQLEILDLTGQIVYIDNIILSNNSLELNLTNIPTGSYILRIITKDKIYTQKWIKN